jgi:RNA-directed DNA polymerase
MPEAKSYVISKQVVWEAYQKVKANHGAAGVDGESLEVFEKDLKNNLYKIWNRMSSGSYFPPPVRVVEIPKASGGLRLLGIPTVGDRVAQMVVKMHLEPLVEPHFHPDSYGYRPGKSALDAVATTRQRCWRYDWVIDLDIQGFFDNLDWELVLKAVRHHVQAPWILLYIERWLKAPAQKQDGGQEERTKGSPQGAVISPLLANLFLHYAFDAWMRRTYPDIPFERYADDVIIHAKSHAQAEQVLAAVRQRLRECRLELHPEKTRIVYCQDSDRKGQHEHIQVRLPGLHVSAAAGQESLGEILCEFPACDQPQGRLSDPGDHPELAAGRHPEQSVSGRSRAACQSFGTWLGELLWSVLPVGAHSGPQTSGTCPHQVGMPEIQTVAVSLHQRSALAGSGSAPRSPAVRCLADGDTTGDWIIRAG